MTRIAPLLLLGLLAACSEGPELMAPEAIPTTDIPELVLLAGDPILDAIERIAPTLADQSMVRELQAALRDAKADARAVELILARLEADPAFAPDADAIRLAIATR